MKYFNYFKKTCLLLFAIPVISFAQDKDVVIRIIQNESIKLSEFETDIFMKKKQFKVQVMLDHAEGVYVFASIQDSVYRFTENSPIRDFSYLNLLELKETDTFNTNKELNLSETGWSYWSYNDSLKWHSFSRNTVGIGNKRVVGTKYIKQLYDVATDKTIKFKDLKSPLYLLFIAVKEYDENGKPLKELMRRKVKITFANKEKEIE
ncbi:MAG: hypothetical protein ABIP79_10730 [Chitinophagaceae bacterium]